MLNRYIRNFLFGLGLAMLAPLTVLANEIHSTAVKVACVAPPWHLCSALTQNATNFNATAINPGSTIWFNANFKASNIPQSGATVFFKNQTITFTAGGVNYTLPVPDSVIRFESRTCSTTTFQGRRKTWITKMPLKGDDEVFLAGLSYLVPSGFGTVTNPVTWSGTFSVPQGSGMSAQWKWGAAVYSQFTDRYNRLQVKAGHQTSCTAHNGDHAGTPEGVNSFGMPWKQFVIGGGTGGGGSNWTGSFSGTVTVTPTCT